MRYKITKFDELDSTNSEAARGDYRHGDIVTAQWQSQGRGQRGNRWVSKAGDNLMFSLVIEPKEITVYEQFRVSLLASLSASDAIGVMGVECKLKWPNDLYVGDKKIGGILIEHNSMGEYISRSIIGIGINVNQEEFDRNLPNPTSLRCHQTSHSNITPCSLLEEFCKAFTRRYSQSLEELSEDYKARLWRATGCHRFKDKDGEFTGEISNINPCTGEITLSLGDSSKRSYFFKEVEFIL
ncbi:MAG: biotin--[acetyl-CoA-carboxylase] ligase [Rikenellaceae bacterium]